MNRKLGFSEILPQCASVLPRIRAFGSRGTAAFSTTKELLTLKVKDANDGWYRDNNWHKQKDHYDDAPQPCIAGFLWCLSVLIGSSSDWSRRYRCFHSLVVITCMEPLPTVLTVHESFPVNRFSRINIGRSAVRATQSELVILIRHHDSPEFRRVAAV